MQGNDSFDEDSEFLDEDFDGPYTNQLPPASDEFEQVLPKSPDFSKFQVTTDVCPDAKCAVCSRQAPFFSAKDDACSCLNEVVCYDCFYKHALSQQVFDNGHQYRQRAPFIPVSCPLCRNSPPAFRRPKTRLLVTFYENTFDDCRRMSNTKKNIDEILAAKTGKLKKIKNKISRTRRTFNRLDSANSKKLQEREELRAKLSRIDNEISSNDEKMDEL